MDGDEYPVSHDLDRDDLDDDSGMIGSETEEPGPGRDQRLTNPDPSEYSAENPTDTASMSENDPERTRLGAHEVMVAPGDPGMIGSETEEPGPGRDQRLTNPDPSEISAENPTDTASMSGDEPERTRLGAQERESE
jgi:hypothetical protein